MIFADCNPKISRYFWICYKKLSFCKSQETKKATHGFHSIVSLFIRVGSSDKISNFIKDFEKIVDFIVYVHPKTYS